MGKAKVSRYSTWFDKLSAVLIIFAGSPFAFIGALMIIVLWAVIGPAFKFSEAWQITINTFTGIITFLMVFIIQQSQNKDILALHLKLNELIAANKGASNMLVSAEDLTKEELAILKESYTELSIPFTQEKAINDHPDPNKDGNINHPEKKNEEKNKIAPDTKS